MKIVQYCQHVLGIGHFFRTLEICRALSDHEVVLVTGGEPVETPLPPHVREVRLPALMMDETFSAVHAADAGGSVAEIRARRTRRLLEIVSEERPDLFLVELYPFGRKAFRFELDPVLSAIREGEVPGCRSVCGLRDILVEKKDPAKYEERVIGTLNRRFDAVLIHADPKLVRLEETFTRTGEIRIPLVYTGFVTPKPPPGAGEAIRRSLGMGPGERLAVASAGGGKVGGPLLTAALAAFQKMDREGLRLEIFTGPYLADAAFRDLCAAAETGNHGDIRVRRFTPDFLSHLAGADLSVSMAGYNTTMNLLAAGTPALVHPFGQNREQGLRADRLAALGAVTVLSDADLAPDRLARQMASALSRGRLPEPPVDLDGAARTAQWIEGRWTEEPRQKGVLP